MESFVTSDGGRPTLSASRIWAGTSARRDALRVVNRRFGQMDDRGLEERLDRIVAILQLAFREPLAEAREAIRRDLVNVALLDQANDDWVAAGDLKKHAMEVTKQSKATVERRIASLVDAGGLMTEGGGPSVKYRSTGLL